MHPEKVQRNRLKELTDLPNVGLKIAKLLRSIGITSPQMLKGEDPFKMYHRLCNHNGYAFDKCVLDIFISITDFMDGNKAQVWWAYTPQRKIAEKRR